VERLDAIFSDAADPDDTLFDLHLLATFAGSLLLAEIGG
jgi:hypothetical protein